MKKAVTNINCVGLLNHKEKFNHVIYRKVDGIEAIIFDKIIQIQKYMYVFLHLWILDFPCI